MNVIVSFEKPMTIFGDGKQTRGFSYIDDVAPVIAKISTADIPAWAPTPAPGSAAALARQVFGKDICQHVVCSYEDCLDLPQFDGFSQMVDLHVYVAHLSGHRIVSSFNCSLIVAEHARRVNLFTRDLIE